MAGEPFHSYQCPDATLFAGGGGSWSIRALDPNSNSRLRAFEGADGSRAATEYLLMLGQAAAGKTFP
jgi:hypothetical protein